MKDTTSFQMRYLIRLGLLAGVITVYAGAVGMIGVFSGRPLIGGVLTLGQVLIVAAPIVAGYLMTRRAAPDESIAKLLASGAIIGAMATLPVFALIALADGTNIRSMFINASPALVSLLTFGQGMVIGTLLLLTLTILAGVLGAGFTLVPEKWRRSAFTALLWTLVVGLLSELFIVMLRPLFGAAFIRAVFVQGAPRPLSALAFFAIVSVSR